MGITSNLVALSLLIVLASTAELAQASVFDVTKYGAKQNVDIAQALNKAWKEACASANSNTVLIPKGNFKLSEVSLKGPCKRPIGISLQGTLQAPTTPKANAWVTFANINALTLSGNGVFDGEGNHGWQKNDCNKNKHCTQLPINLRFDFITNSIVKDITSLDSKNFHVNVLGGNNVTFQNMKIIAPENSPNTDGIHIGRSQGIKIIDTKIATGDDCISLGDGSKQITITGVTCGPGHGISIGSLGKYTNEEPVEGVTVKKCKLISTTNGVRIKTWPASAKSGSASNMRFEDIEMVNVSNPVIIDQEYCPWNQCNRKIPSKIKLSKVIFKNIKGTSATPVAVKLVCSKNLPCQGVEVGNIDLKYIGKVGTITSECANVKPTLFGTQNPRTCAAVAIPGAPTT